MSLVGRACTHVVSHTVMITVRMPPCALCAQVSLLVGLRERFDQQPCISTTVHVRILDPQSRSTAEKRASNMALLSPGRAAHFSQGRAGSPGASNPSTSPVLQQLQSIGVSGNGAGAAAQKSSSHRSSKA
eukprot:1159940-Pelagomonas_calceolata.AAC.15